MIRDITIGQYYPADSYIHKLDPRTKIIGTFVFIISLFIQKSIFTYLIATLFLGGVIYISKVPLRFILRGLKPIFFILIFSVLVNMCFTPGIPLIHFGFITITEQGIKTAAYMGIRLMYLILGSSLMTFTTTPTQLTDGLEYIFRGLKVIHVPVHEIAMMMSIALRFIPILTEELDKIMKAQMARCADFDSGNLLNKVKSLIPVLVPLFISAIRRANDLAMAMEARCYNGSVGRTKMKPLEYKNLDTTGYTILTVYLVLMFVIGILL